MVVNLYPSFAHACTVIDKSIQAGPGNASDLPDWDERFRRTFDGDSRDHIDRSRLAPHLHQSQANQLLRLASVHQRFHAPCTWCSCASMVISRVSTMMDHAGQSSGII
jgi:hypothetical protein